MPRETGEGSARGRDSAMTGKLALIAFRVAAVLCLVLALGLGERAFRATRRASVAVEWSTGSEVETVGFHVYRATDANGPFERITDVPVPASGAPLTGSSYAYVDRSAAPGATYWYQLEDLDAAGNTTRHGAVKVTADARPWLAPAVLAAAVGAAAIYALASTRR